MAYINEPKMPFSRVTGISALAKEPSEDAAAIQRISMDRTTASYKRLKVQQKVTEFHMSSYHKDTIRLLYLYGSSNYEPLSLIVRILAKETPRFSTCYLNLDKRLE